jgi:hypothetical protein
MTPRRLLIGNWFGSDRQVVGVLAALELFMSRADERENEFLLKLLEKHHARLKANSTDTS